MAGKGVGVAERIVVEEGNVEAKGLQKLSYIELEFTGVKNMAIVTVNTTIVILISTNKLVGKKQQLITE